MAHPLVYAALGAAFAYLLDPQSGRRRRTELKARWGAAARSLDHGRQLVARDAANRAHGLLAETRGALRGRHDPGYRGPSLAEVGRDALASWMRERWSPSQRAAAAASGAAFAAFGYARGGARGLLLFLLGTTLLARAGTNERLAALATSRGIHIEKQMHVAAPVEEVFAHWRNLENFPLWMSHVREVRYIGDDRFHWVVDGPAGLPVEWDAELLNVSEDREMTWRSVEGSAVYHVGRVRFEPEDGGTRIDLQLRYSPPGGPIGHAVARAFGTDPKSEIDDDLLRLKTLIETGNLPRDSAALRRLAAEPPRAG